MTAPTTLVWRLAGEPEPAKPLEGVPGWCAVSGEWCERTADVERTLGSNFTDRRVFTRPDSTRVGPGALWALTGRGMQTLRLWTIVAGADRHRRRHHQLAGHQGDQWKLAHLLQGLGVA